MSTITGTAIINKAATILFDGNNIKWSRPELLTWLNDGQRALVAMLPEASSTRAIVQLVIGARQSIPAAGWMLLEVISNMGTNGTTRGSAIKEVDARKYDETNPGWMDAPATSAAALCMYNARDKTAFDVYPPADGTGFVDLLYSASPADLPSETSVISVMDLYSPALLDYVLFRAKSKDGPFASDPQVAQAYFQSFVMYITGDASVIGRLASQQGQLAVPAGQQQGSAGNGGGGQ